MSMTPLEIARERIEECRRTRSTELDLSGLELEEIPEQVFELTWLEKLDVSGDMENLEPGNIRRIPLAIQKLSSLISFSCSLNAIIDISPLSGLQKLQFLVCWGNKISSLSGLSSLTQLQHIDCYGNEISDLSPLCNLVNLESLLCGSNNINDLSSLANLKQLQILDCTFTLVIDLESISGLSNLQSLTIENNEIKDLSPLKSLKKLQSLNCTNNQIFDLSPLGGLMQLYKLNCSENQISDLSPLRQLTNLRSISCIKNQISDLSPLEHLSQLQFIDCGFNRVRKLPLLNRLMQLRSFSCWANLIADLSPLYGKVLEGRLNHLSLSLNPVFGVPNVILGDDINENCLESLRNYWQDLAKSSERQQQLKVQLVGNGRVGKTTLAYALEHKRAPSEPFKSTHGIVIKEIQQALDGEDEPVTLQLWDFGGQEIYHATHRLFLSDDCLYLLLWAEETEEHPGEARHPVSYWLELINDLAPNSPVILLKNQIDRFDELLPIPPDLAEDVTGYNQIQQSLKVSAFKYKNINALRGAIQDVLAKLKHRVCLELPTSWLQVQRELKQLDQNTIPFAHFKQLCIKAGVGHAEWFVGYLHKTGVLFYQEGAFQDQIILDQNWAINAVYRVFDPENHRSFIEDDLKGRFKGRHAKIVWPEVEETEREIYLDFMRNCGICYEPNRKHDTPFAERTFIIPALLPEDSPTRSAWQKNATDWQLDIEYSFLHRSIIERIILRLGETYQGEPWRTGIFCNTEHGQVLLECEYQDKKQSTQGQLSFHLRGNQLAPLVYALRKLVSKISPHRHYQEFLRKGNEERAQLPEFKENPQMPTPLDETETASKTIKLFISYAHEDEKPYREELDKRLKAIKRQYPMLEPWHDRNLRAGEQVHDKILQQLEVADIVVLLISPDFVDSDYCFSHEMEIALKQYEQNQNIVIPIIIRDTADWHTYQIGNHVALPTDGKPLCDWSSPDKFWADVQQGIRKQVEQLLPTTT